MLSSYSKLLMMFGLHILAHMWPGVAGAYTIGLIGSLPNSDPSAILYCPALTAAMDDEMSGAPLPKARKVTACPRMSLQDSCAVQLEGASCERVYIPPARRGGKPSS